MDSKPLAKSKTAWLGIIVIILSLAQLAYIGEIDPTVIIELLAGCGLITLRQAVD